MSTICCGKSHRKDNYNPNSSATRQKLVERGLFIVSKGRGKINFSIDGLADTNPTYRVNANWDKVIENVKTFIKAGGPARWDYPSVWT